MPGFRLDQKTEMEVSMHKFSVACAAAMLLLSSVPIAAYADATDETYLCNQLDRIRAEEEMPAISAGIVLPEPGYPQTAPRPFYHIACARGVERADGATPVTASTLFWLGSVSKPITGLMVSRVIAAEAGSSAPRLTWQTKLKDFFPDYFRRPETNACYAERTVADLMAHTAGFPDSHPANAPSEESEPDPKKRRALYTAAALQEKSWLDVEGTSCFDNGVARPQLGFFYSNIGSIVAAHMAEVVTGRSWEDLMARSGSTTAGPGLTVGTVWNPAVSPSPVAYWHTVENPGLQFVPIEKPSSPTHTHGPAGWITVSTPQMALLLEHFLEGSAGAGGRLLPDGERPTLLTGHGLSMANRLGWFNTSLDTANFGTTARWVATAALSHNGSNGSHYSEAYLVPAENSAIFVMLSAVDKSCLPRSLLTRARCDRWSRALNKSYSELAALRLHHGEAVDIIRRHHQLNQAPAAKPSVSVLGVPRISSAPQIVDGRLTTGFAAPAGAATPTFTITYPAPRSMDRIVVVENGDAKILEYELAIQDAGGVWRVVAKNTRNEELIFPHRVFSIPRPTVGPTPLLPGAGSPSVSVNRIRLRVIASTDAPEILEIAGIRSTGSIYRPLWWRQGFAEALAPKGPILDPGPLIGDEKIMIERK